MNRENNRSKLIQIIDGEPMVNGAFVLLMNADVAYGHEKANAVGRARAHEFLREAFRQMRIAGYGQVDILETVLSQSTSTDKAVDMASDAMTMIGTDGMFAAMRAAGFNPIMKGGVDDAN